MVRDDGRQITKLVLCERIAMMIFEAVVATSLIFITIAVISIACDINNYVSKR